MRGPLGAHSFDACANPSPASPRSRSHYKKHRPRGKVAHGKITIVYLADGGPKVGTVKATIKATFTSKTHATGTTSISGGNCKNPTKGKFSADRVKK